MSEDVLKKPVHVVVLKDAYIRQLQDKGKLPKTAVSTEVPPRPVLPREEKVRPQGVVRPAIPKSNVVRKTATQTKLRVLYDRIPPLPADKVPPCNTCVAACCYAFIVEITKEEYDSGLYGDAAVKITPDMAKQFKGTIGSFHTMLVPTIQSMTDENVYLLEGKVGEPCPFLDGTKCSIYDDRPVVCRTYTCVDDPRITDDMRAGKTTILEEMDASK